MRGGLSLSLFSPDYSLMLQAPIHGCDRQARWWSVGVFETLSIFAQTSMYLKISIIEDSLQSDLMGELHARPLPDSEKYASLPDPGCCSDVATSALRNCPFRLGFAFFRGELSSTGGSQGSAASCLRGSVVRFSS